MACWLVGIPFILFSSSVLWEHILVYLGGYPPTSGSNFHTKWWEDNPRLHHWFLPHCWKKQHVCAPLTSQLGSTTPEAPLLRGPFCWAGCPQEGIQLLPFSDSEQLLFYRKMHFSDPSLFTLTSEEILGFHHCWCPITSLSSPSASQPLCELRLERPDAFWGD